MIPKEAQCPRNGIHDFKTIGEYPDAFVESCRFCSEKAIYRRDASGRMDNRRYLRAHFRSFVQPHGATSGHFRQAWGDKAYWQAVRSTKWKKPVDWDEAMVDARKYLRELQKEKVTS